MKEKESLCCKAVVNLVSEFVNHNLYIDRVLSGGSQDKKEERWQDGLKSLIEAIEALIP